MPPKLPTVGGHQLIKLLNQLGYETVRQRGSHIRLKRETERGKHFVTVPAHRQLAKGTLSDILTSVSRETGIPKKELIEMLKEI